MSFEVFVYMCALVVVIGVLLWFAILYIVQNDEKIAKFFSEDPEINDFEELRKNGR